MAANLTRKELLGKVYKMIPPMLEKFHKGKLIVVGVVNSIIMAS